MSLKLHNWTILVSCLDNKHTLSSEIIEFQRTLTSTWKLLQFKSHLWKSRVHFLIILSQKYYLLQLFPHHVQLSTRSFYQVSNSNLVEKVKTLWPPFSYNFHQQISTFHIKHHELTLCSDARLFDILNYFSNKQTFKDNSAFLINSWFIFQNHTFHITYQDSDYENQLHNYSTLKCEES